jgi:phosphoribosylformimino-5-aminoimidazole carboxamide ribotide isomerase
MKFNVIPVIDIRKGLVVRAVMGRRDLYKPIETPLSPTPEPLAVASGLLKLHAFEALYIADIDAIEAKADNTGVVSRLREQFPHIDLWTDNGANTPNEVGRWLDCDLGTLVLGSESQASCDTVGSFVDNPRIALSLDFRGEAFQGPATLLDPSYWPHRVIAMTLACVGRRGGPDFKRLAALRAQAVDHLIYAAGGVRGVDDLARLAQMGIAGALVASALHDGRLDERGLAQTVGH